MCLYTFTSMYVFPFGQRLWEKGVMLLGRTWGNTQELGECRKVSLRDLLSFDLLLLNQQITFVGLMAQIYFVEFQMFSQFLF